MLGPSRPTRVAPGDNNILQGATPEIFINQGRAHRLFAGPRVRNSKNQKDLEGQRVVRARQCLQ